MRISFQQPISAVGVVPPLGVAATLASTASSGYLLNRIGLGRLLAASSLLSAVALVVSAASPTMGLFPVSVVLLGLSGGAIDATLNACAARNLGPRRINFLHASYGVGAATSPLIPWLSPQLSPSRVEPRLDLQCPAQLPAQPHCRRARTVHLSG
jgi:MFS family permease